MLAQKNHSYRFIKLMLNHPIYAYKRNCFCVVLSALNTKTLFTAFIWLSSHTDLEIYLSCSCSVSSQKIKHLQTQDESAHGGSMFFFLFLINQ